MKKITILTIIAAGTLALSGCTTVTVDEPQTYPYTADESLYKNRFTVAAEIYCPPVEPVHLSESEIDFNAEDLTAYVCVDMYDTELLPTSSEQVRVVTGNLDELIQAYSEPNDKIVSYIETVMPKGPYIVNIKSDNKIVPIYSPVDDHGSAKSAAEKAYQELKLENLNN